MSMSLDTKKGDKITITDATCNNGFESDRLLIRKHLKPGENYTVKYVDLGKFYSVVYIEEVPDVAFNTVNFENVTE